MESPLLMAPTGELIDGRRLLAEEVGFGRALRAALPTTEDVEREEEGEPGEPEDADEGREATMREIARLGVQESIDLEDGAETEGETISPEAWSEGEGNRHP